MHSHPLSSTLIVVLLSACSADPRTVSSGALRVSPTSLEWTLRAGDDEVEQSVVVENTGDAPVVVFPVWSAIDARFTRVSDADEVHIAPGARTTVAVRFAPTHAAPAFSTLTFVSAEGERHEVRLRADVTPRADCRLLVELPEDGEQLSPIPLEVGPAVDALGVPGAEIAAPLRWSLVDMPDLKGPRLFADTSPFGLAVGLTSLPVDDGVIGGHLGHLNVVQRGALYTVRVRDDGGRGCEATFFADENLPGDYPHRSVVLTWQGEADLDLHVARLVDGAACYVGPFVDEERRCGSDDAARTCSSRRCASDENDWNGDVYDGTRDAFAQPRVHPTGQGAELVYFSGTFGEGEAQIAVEAIDAAGPVVFTLRVFHGRLAFQSRTGVIFPGELRALTTTTF